MRTPVLVSTLLVACGGGSGGSTNDVTLDTSGTPLLVAVKHGTADWQAVAVDGNRYEIAVDEPYIVAVACNDVADLFDTYLFARTPEDSGELQAPCTGEGPPLDGTIVGTVAQAAEIRVGFNSVSTGSANEEFRIAASAGLHDVVVRTDDEILIRRDVDVFGETRLSPLLDLTDGAPFVPTNFILAPDPDETTFGFVELFTEHGTLAFGFGSPETLRLVPDTLLTTADRQIVQVAASRGSLTRAVTFGDAHAPSPVAVELPPHLEGVSMIESGGVISASWGALPAHEEIEMTLDQSIGPELRFHTLELSPAYADAMGTAIVFDLAIPGFDPAGAIDVTAPYSRSFVASTDRDNKIVASTLFENVNQPTAAKPHRVVPRKARR